MIFQDRKLLLGPHMCIYKSHLTHSLYISHTQNLESLFLKLFFLVKVNFLSLSRSLSSSSSWSWRWSHRNIIIKPTKKTATTTSPALVVIRVVKRAQDGHQQRSKSESSKIFTTTTESDHQRPTRFRRSL